MAFCASAIDSPVTQAANSEKYLLTLKAGPGKGLLSSFINSSLSSELGSIN